MYMEVKLQAIILLHICVCGSLTIIKKFHWELIARAISKQSLHEKSHLINAVAGSWEELEQEKIRWRLELSKSLSYHTLGTVSPLPWAYGLAFLQRTGSHIAEGRAKAVGKMILCKNGSAHPQLHLQAMPHT